MLGHVPLWVFAMGILATSMLVISYIDSESARVSLGLTANGADAVLRLSRTYTRIWIACLVAFFAATALGSALVAWTQRLLSGRIARIVRHAELIGSGQSTNIEREANDALGRLERSLEEVASSLSSRDRARQAENEEREQVGRIQRAMLYVDGEGDACRVVTRSLRILAPGMAAELYLAGADLTELRRVAESPGVAPPGCGIVSPSRCPAIHQGVTLQFPDSEALDACPRLHEDCAAPSAALCVPVVMMGRAAGVLHLVRPRGETFSAPLQRSLEALASFFGTRAGTMRALATSRLEAETDALTGLLNRRSLEVRASHVLASSARAAVVLCDLDRFKRLNDEHGHAAGDLALKTFARVLKVALRPSDTVARYGGEEFALVLADCGADEAVRALQRVRALLATEVAKGPAFTASFGVAEFPLEGAGLDLLLKAADKALYRAKAEGRDRVATTATLTA